VLLAHLDDDALARYLTSADLRASTASSITKAPALRKTLQSVRQTGYAWVDAQFDPAISGIAVPLRDPAGHVVAAINVNLISGSYTEETAKKRFLVPLRHAAEQIRRAMPH